MEVQYDKEIYGIMCIREEAKASGGSIVFELKFRSIGNSEKVLLKGKLDKTDNLGSCSFKILRSYCSDISKKIFCANWDESRSFVWANATVDYIMELLA